MEQKTGGGAIFSRVPPVHFGSTMDERERRHLNQMPESSLPAAFNIEEQ